MCFIRILELCATHIPCYECKKLKKQQSEVTSNNESAYSILASTLNIKEGVMRRIMFAFVMAVCVAVMHADAFAGMSVQNRAKEQGLEWQQQQMRQQMLMETWAESERIQMQKCSQEKEANDKNCNKQLHDKEAL